MVSYLFQPKLDQLQHGSELAEHNGLRAIKKTRLLGLITVRKASGLHNAHKRE